MTSRWRSSRELLTVAQIAWVAIALVSVALYIGAMPRYFHQTLTLTNQDGFIPRNPAQWRVGLRQIDLSPEFYAAVAVGGRSIMALSLVLSGVVIFLKRSRDWFALFLTLSLLVFGCVTPPVTGEYTQPVLASLTQVLFSFGQSFLLILYLFPDGTFQPRWIRWCIVPIVASYFVPNADLQTAISLFLVVTLIVAPIYRYRSVATPTQRQQMKWALVGLLAATVVIMADIQLYTLFPGLASTDRAKVIFDLATLASVVLVFPLIPIFLAIAILRYRLWDIDTLINRTLVYGSLTLSLAAVYAGAVVVLEAVTRAITGQRSEFAIAVATLAVAALFNPWRRRLQAFIDRRFYRRRYDATRTLAVMSSRLRDDVDIDTLVNDIIGVVDQTLQPSHVSLWLHEEAVR